MTEPAPASTGRQLVRSSALVAVGTALSRVTGFLRVTAIAAIGFTRLTDVYNIANSTPNIVYELLLGGILTATLVPLYVQYLERQDDDAAAAVNTVALVALLAISVLGFLLAPWIIQLYTLRLSGAARAEQQELATALLRLFMPQIFFYGLAALGEAMLNARRRFGVAAFVPVVNNLVVIAVFLTLPRLTDDLTVPGVADDTGLVLLLGLGTTAGVVAMALLLLPALRRVGVRIRLSWNWRHPAVRQVARLSGWTFGYVATNQIAFWIALFLAYGKSGDASVYLAAFTFFQLPHGLFSVSIMVALGPVLAAHANRGDLPAFRSAFTDGFRLMTLVVLPASGVMIVLAGPIVNAVLRYGDFSAASARATSGTLAAFGIGLLFFSSYLYTLRAFYAMQDTRSPFFLNCLENALNVALALVLYPWLGVRGLALAWSVAYVVAAIAALLALRRRVGRLEGRRTARAVGPIVAASAVTTVLVGGVGLVLPHDTAGDAIVACAVALSLGGGVYLLALRLLHVPELAVLRDADAARAIGSGSVGRTRRAGRRRLGFDGRKRGSTMPVRVVTDSACDLPDDLVDQLAIEIVPLTIRFGSEELVDRKELSAAEFWRRLASSPTLPETAAPSAGAFETAFRGLLADGADGIVCINLSSKLSATMQSAQVAAQSLADTCPVAVIDSLTASMGIGSLVVSAARQAAAGGTLDDIVRDVTSRRDRTKLFGTLDTLEFLRKGGRIGAAQALLGSMLSIKPVVEVRDGVVAEAGKVRTRSKALRTLADHVGRQPVERLAVLHGDAPDLSELLDLLTPYVPRDEIIVGVVGPVIGTHAGPRVIGVTFQTTA